MSKEVDKKFSACKQFFLLEIEARVVAATLDYMEICRLDDTPDEEVLPSSLTDASDETQAAFLKKIANDVVDNYIINEDNIAILMEDLEKHRYNDVGKLDNGRFACRFNSCSKTFAHDGKRRIAHEKTHGMHSHSTDKQHTICPVPVKDDVSNYQHALLEYGMLFLNFCDAISEGDGSRILRCWKFFLMFL